MHHRIDTVLRRGTGLAVPGASVTVYLTGTLTKPQLYSTNGTGSPRSNPIVTDGNGGFEYYIADGVYDEKIQYGSIVVNRTYLQMFDLGAIVATLLASSSTATIAAAQAVTSAAAALASQTGAAASATAAAASAAAAATSATSAATSAATAVTSANAAAASETNAAGILAQVQALVGSGGTIALPSSLPAGSTTVPYSQSVAASGGTGPYTYAVVAGTLPTGLSLNTSTGTITGTPSAAGSFGFTIRATDSAARTGQVAYSVAVSLVVVTVNPTSITSPTYSVAYSQALTAAGGTAPYLFTISSGALPAGLTMSSAGLITGTPTATTSATFIVQAVDANGAIGVRSYTVSIQASSSITAPVLTRTSTAGAAPLLFTTGLDNSNTFPGDAIRYQVATDSGFTAITQDISHLYTEGEYEGLDIDITAANGFATPSGLYYMRARVERDDGSVSSYSSSMTDTITAASMVLATTTGQHKDSNVTVTGTPALSFSSSGSFGIGTLRGSRSFTGTKVWEITPGALPAGNDFRMGLDSGSVSLNGSYYNAGETAGSDGAALVIQPTATWRIDFGGSAGGYTARTHVSTDVYMIEHDTATGIARWYVTPSGGSRTLLGTKTLGAGAMFPWFGTRQSGTTISVNFGQSAFAGVPTSGYTFP